MNIVRYSEVVNLIIKCISYLVPINKNIVVFGSFMGSKYGDNSASFFEYCNTQQKGVYEYYWLSDRKDIVDTIKLKHNSNAFLKKSFRGIWISLRANIFVTSHGIQDVIFYPPISGRVKELYLHHGLPLRGGGRIDSAFYDINRLKNIVGMAATSTWGGAQQKRNIPIELSKILVTGYPRNDIFFNANGNEKDTIRKDIGVSGFVVLYAPTWRKWKTTTFFPFDDFELDILVKFLRGNEITIVLRPHSVDMRRLNSKEFFKSLKWCEDVIKIVTIERYNDTQKLLLISDILITDYSSIFYDYLLLDRPIIFFPYDIDDYSERMGSFLVDYHADIPGQKIYKQISFIESLERYKSDSDNYQIIRKDICRKAHKFFDGKDRKSVV
mgnify:CR=1 FL=1